MKALDRLPNPHQFIYEGTIYAPFKGEGAGKVVNGLYNEWNSIKNAEGQKKWEEKVKGTLFGTYDNQTVSYLVEKWLEEDPHIKLPPMFKDFLKEVKIAEKK